MAKLVSKVYGDALFSLAVEENRATKTRYSMPPTARS